MKYRLNENPGYHVCPTIERIPSDPKDSHYPYAAIYDDYTIIYKSKNSREVSVVGNERDYSLMKDYQTILIEC